MTNPRLITGLKAVSIALVSVLIWASSSTSVCVISESSQEKNTLVKTGQRKGRNQSNVSGTQVDLRIRNVTVVSADVKTPRANVDVLVDQGRIVRMSTGNDTFKAAKTIDGTGRFLIPGLIDSHVHLYHASGLKARFTRNFSSLYAGYLKQLPRSYLYYGYTTVVELNVDFEINQQFEANAVRPDLCHCGQGLVLSNDFMATDFEEGEFHRYFPNFLHDRFTTPTLPPGFDPKDHTPAATVARIAKAGGRCVKLYYEEALWWPGEKRPDFALPSEAIIKEVVKEAHQRGMTVILHGTTPRAHRFALATGIDVLAHGLWEWPDTDPEATVIPDLIAKVSNQVAASSVAVQPTIQTLRNELSLTDPTFLDNPALSNVLPGEYLTYLRTEAQAQLDPFEKRVRRVYAKMYPQKDLAKLDIAKFQRNYIHRYEQLLGRMAKRKAHFLFGTDTAVGGFGWGNPPGLNGYWEMQSWSRAGIPLSTIFKAATLDNARAFGLAEETGSVTVGKRANLLLLTKNPLQQLEAYDSIEYVILNGKVIDRSELKAQ